MKKLKLEELNRLTTDAYKNVSKNPLVLILDNIRSMHNVGAVFRSSDAFRVEKIWLCGYTAKPPHREIRKTAIGAEESVAWEYRKNMLSLLEELKQKGWKILALEQTDGSIPLKDFEVHKNEKLAVILGNEVEGVNADALPFCDTALEIKQFGTKHSLNVSVASGILLYELHNKLTRIE